MTNPTTPDTATRAASEDAGPTPWATTRTLPRAASEADGRPAPDAAAPSPTAGPGRRVEEGVAPATAPALNPPTWSGRKTAVAAALAIGISSVGAVGAAAALPAGSATRSGPGQFQQGGLGRGGQLPGGQSQQGFPGGQAQQGPTQPGQARP